MDKFSELFLIRVNFISMNINEIHRSVIWLTCHIIWDYKSIHFCVCLNFEYHSIHSNIHL